MVKILGEGAFGQVWKADMRVDDHSTIGCAVKMLKQSARDPELADLISEMEVMKLIGHHPNIINLIGCATQGEGPLWVIVELCSNGNLRDFLRKHRPKPESANGQQQKSSFSAGSSGGGGGAASRSGLGSRQRSEESQNNSEGYLRPNGSCHKDLSPQNSADEKVLTHKDLVQFAYQVAKGMDYLASKKVRSLGAAASG